jgi:hypothetical protein
VSGTLHSVAEGRPGTLLPLLHLSTAAQAPAAAAHISGCCWPLLLLYACVCLCPALFKGCIVWTVPQGELGRQHLRPESNNTQG